MYEIHLLYHYCHHHRRRHHRQFIFGINSVPLGH